MPSMIILPRRKRRADWIPHSLPRFGPGPITAPAWRMQMWEDELLEEITRADDILLSLDDFSIVGGGRK